MMSIRYSQLLKGRCTITVALIAFNVLVWSYEILLEKSGFEIASDYGLVSWRFVNAFHLPQWQGGILENAMMPLITSMFMHSSWRHIISNSFFLWILGHSLERSLGHARFLAFYLVCGIGASLGHVMLDPHCMSPIIGASGAIAGLGGGGLVLLPRERIGITIAKRFFYLPAFLWVALFLSGSCLTNAVLSQLIPEVKPASIGHLLHAGGFVTGVVLAIIYRVSRVFANDLPASCRNGTPLCQDSADKGGHRAACGDDTRASN